MFFQTSPFHAVGKIVMGAYHQTQVATDSGMLGVLLQLLMHPSPPSRRQPGPLFVQAEPGKVAGAENLPPRLKEEAGHSSQVSNGVY